MKKIILLIDAFLVLFLINNGLRLIQFHLIFLKIEFPLSFLLMILFSLIARYILIIVYDHLKTDWFLIEKIKIKINEKSEDQNSLTKKIINLKSTGFYSLFIGLALIDPIFMVIYFREGSWNNIPNVKIFSFFAFSCFVCGLGSMLIFQGILIIF